MTNNHLFNNTESASAGSVTIPADSTFSTFGTSGTDLPTLNDPFYSELPEYIQRITQHATTPTGRLQMLIASLVTLGSTMNNVTSTYDRRQVSPNLFFYTTGKAASGKSDLVLMRHLVQPIHEQLVKLHQANMQVWEAADKNTPKPLPKQHLIAANSSTAALINALGGNSGIGLLIETESDTLASTWRNDWSGYSDLLCKAWHNEPIEKCRVADGTVSVQEPKLAVAISSTPAQVQNIIPSAESGLASRFLFIAMPSNTKVRNPYIKQGSSLDDIFKEYGAEWHIHYQHLQQEPHQFICTTEQGTRIQQFQQEELEDVAGLHDADDLDATILRAGLQVHKIATILCPRK